MISFIKKFHKYFNLPQARVSWRRKCRNVFSLFILSYLLVHLTILWAETPGTTQKNRPGIIVAQNTETDQSTSEEKKASPSDKPLPSAKTVISTEKPIKKIPAPVTEKGKEGQEGDVSSPPKEGIPSQSSETPPAGNEGVPVVLPPATVPQVTIPSSPAPTPLPAKEPIPSTKLPKLVTEEISLFSVSTANLRTMKLITDKDFNLRGMVYGEELGYIRKLTADNNGNFKEVWKSDPLTAPVRGVFVDDIDNDSEAEIVTYTANGNFFIYGYDSYSLKYRSPEGTYQSISCMAIGNIDSDREKEILIIGVKPGTTKSSTGETVGNLIQFDPKTMFEEWVSSELYSATDMIIGNVDTDDEIEIILNTGEIMSSRFKSVKWKSDIKLGDRLYLIDLDSDGILELVTEYGQSSVRIFDVDQRREKW
jgi:hypothetical protein